MSRPLRVQFAGGLYHVTARGNNRLPIYLDDADRQQFLSALAKVVHRYRLVCHAYCLMGNHYHVLFETPDANLARAMRQLNGVYAQHFNRRHQRSGHLLEGRYHAQVVDRDSYLAEVCRYVVLNPVRAGLVTSVGQWPWSSYGATAGLVPRPPFLTVDWVLELTQSTDRKEAQRRYRRFVAAGLQEAPRPLEPAEAFLLIDPPWLSGLRAQIERSASLVEVPRVHRHALRPSLEQIFAGVDSREERDLRSALAVRDHGYTMSAVARFLGMHYITVSRAMARQERHGGDVRM